MVVRGVMSNEAITVPLGKLVGPAPAMLESARITSMPVVSANREPCGVTSGADLIHDGVSANSRLHEIHREDFLIHRRQYVDEVMTTRDSRSVPRATWRRLSTMMTTTGVESVPVVAADGRVLGVVSRSDVAPACAVDDRGLGRVVAGTVPGVATVHVSPSG
jgi:CBS-domain-containing membrane protein